MRYKTERFELAEVNQDLRIFATPSKDYLLPSKDFQKKFKPGMKVYEYIFRTLKPQIEDLQISVNGVRIGSIKKGSASHFQKLLADPEYSHTELKIEGGNYRAIDLNGNGDLRLQKNTDRIYAHIIIYKKISSGFLSRIFAK